MRYRRSKVNGACYFFTIVTYRRQPLLAEPITIDMLARAIDRIRERHPFLLEAQVVLPDHIHALWTLPEGDCNYPRRWRLIKEAFTREYVRAFGPTATDERRRARGERAVWQRRYWEHLIRSDRDFTAHVEYIHMNPVRHGLATAAKDWPHSTFMSWVERGLYEVTWGCSELPVPPVWVGRE